MSSRFWLCVVLVLVLAWGAACRKAPKGKVVGVADGDTVTVLDENEAERKVRLNGIDAPEKSQPFGEASKQHLSDLVYGKVVNVEGQETDRYGRLVGVLLLDGQDINLAQLEAGQAWYYRQYESEVAPARRAAYAAAENAARQARRGLWRDPAPEAPWDFRSQQRAANQSDAPRPSVTPTMKTGATKTETTKTDGHIIGNRNSHIYHRPDCPDYQKVGERNRVYFATEQTATDAGFRRAGNCR